MLGFGFLPSQVETMKSLWQKDPRVLPSVGVFVSLMSVPYSPSLFIQVPRDPAGGAPVRARRPRGGGRGARGGRGRGCPGYKAWPPPEVPGTAGPRAAGRTDGRAGAGRNSRRARQEIQASPRFPRGEGRSRGGWGRRPGGCWAR
jgi:hypothetical protein